MAAYYCIECNNETEDKQCPFCGAKTENLEVKDDPLLGQFAGSYNYSEEEQI
jgi:hypothetical protein